MHNLFVVESPLQALCALEIALENKEKKNSIIFKLSGNSRKRSNNQIKYIIGKYSWFSSQEFSLTVTNSFSHHLRTLRFLSSISKLWAHEEVTLYMGEFRSRWMHLLRAAVKPATTHLLDDGAVTLIIKRDYLEKGIYHPKNLQPPMRGAKQILLNFFYGDYWNSQELQKPIKLATSFCIEGEHDGIKVNFEQIKKLFSVSSPLEQKKYAYFFGSKYSEAGIISQKYEIQFLKNVKNFYAEKGLELEYYSHRDESIEKIAIIKQEIGVEVTSSDKPAEIFLLEHPFRPAEVSGAYSSVLNNTKVLFPELVVRAFKLDSSQVNVKKWPDINHIYQHFKEIGIELHEF